MASMQGVEAVNLLSGFSDKINPILTKLDLWNNTVQRIPLSKLWPESSCVCCGRKEFEYLEP
jgi:hypothetical protein